MTLSDKLRDSLSREINHYIHCKDTFNKCERCNKLVEDMKALKVKRND